MNKKQTGELKRRRANSWEAFSQSRSSFLVHAMGTLGAQFSPMHAYDCYLFFILTHVSFLLG